MPVRFLFSAAILLSAFLLFLIQPMLSKIILPLLGGSPAVWQTSMMFYQTLLLGGYVYAHASTHRLGTQRQSKIHIALLLLSVLSLPVTLHATEWFAAVSNPVMFLLVSLSLSIGLPFFVLSANAPLVQHWYACHQQTKGRDPYTLYSASNLGSFGALMAYPFLIEPRLSLSVQTEFWSGLYIVFGLLLVVCIVQLNRHFGAEAPMEGESEEALEDAQVPTTRQKLYWIVLAFIPSSLMLGVTTYVTTDIAAVPLLWIIPLALYLLSFVLAFHPKMPSYHFFLKEQVILIAILLIAKATKLDSVAPFQSVHFLVFFAIAMLCHGQLALSRPKVRHLTGFYVWVSVGGALGGLFNALLAPHIFVSATEYWLVIILACFLRPQTAEAENDKRQRLFDFLLPALLALMLTAIVTLSHHSGDWIPGQLQRLRDTYHSFLGGGVPLPDAESLLVMAFTVLCLGLPRYCQHRPVRFAYAVLVFFFALPFLDSSPHSHTIYSERSFFGISAVKEQDTPPTRVLVHGTTLHGLQSLDEKYRLHLASYYVHIRDIYNKLPDDVRHKPSAIAGLGAGTLACLGQEQQEFDFYEIDAAVQRIAENPKYFTYLSDCPTKKTVHLQDARLGIEAAEDGRYGSIFMDAYSSDALPMHLMTREALASYLKKLAPHGIIAFHISNRYLELNSILANLAADAGLFGIERTARPTEANAVPAEWVVMARSKEDLAMTDYIKAGWKELTPNHRRPWTDDYSNILEALR